MRAFTLFSMLFLINTMTLPTSAADTQNIGFPFIVELSYPENQIEPDAGYFYVDAESRLSHEFTVRVTNTGDKTQQVFIETADCYTSTSGDLVYINKNKSTMVGVSDTRFLLGDHILLPKTELTLKSGESTEYRFTVLTPELEYGEVLGAIRFFVIEKSPQDANREGTQINLDIKRAVSIVIRLRLDQPEAFRGPSITVGDAGFLEEMGQLYITLENNLFFINRNARGHLLLADSKGNTLFDRDLDLIRMAPRSWLKWPIPLNAGIIEAGSLNVAVSLGEAGVDLIKREIRLDRDVEIIEETRPPAAAPINTGLQRAHWVSYGGWLMFGLTAVSLLLIILRKRKKDS